ncbi:MAG: sulfatase-like hydrolase/transferase [Alphaproteobacteria bacterium]|nr:sulfatase-like hydrolase/transferase [Alphaproteobacteria bacterium]
MPRAFALLACFTAVEALTGLARPEIAPQSSATDPLFALALLAPLSLLGAHRQGLSALGVLLLAAVGPHAARVAGQPGLTPWIVATSLTLLPLTWRWPRLLCLPGLLALLLAPAPLLLRAGPIDRAPEGLAGAGPDVLLITVDTLRSDAELVLPGEGWLRADAISAAPWTLPAVHSLLLGAPVRRHRGGLPVEGGFTRPDRSWSPLPERLAARGYVTAAFLTNPHLRAAMGFDRGVHHFEHADRWLEPHVALRSLDEWGWRLLGRVERLQARRDALLVERALAWWAEPQDRPRFAWVHLLLPREHLRAPRPRPPDVDPDDPAQRRAAYAANVAATNALLARLIEGVGEGTRVVLTSDHGESLGEQDLWGHGTAFNDAQLRVPLALRGYGDEAAPRRPLSVTDLAELIVEGDAHPLLRGREVIEVGGLRRDAEAFALRTPDGGYTPRPAPAGPGPAPVSPDPALKQALEPLDDRLAE